MTYTTVDISEDARSALDDATRAEGVSAGEIVDRALKRHLFVRRFRELQADTMEHLRESGVGDLTDEDVFAIDSSEEDARYRLYVMEKVRSGLQRAHTEGVIEQDEAEVRLVRWFIRS